jgi:2-oxoglutarate ferredoxin oxidoreductase subunit alpha
MLSGLDIGMNDWLVPRLTWDDAYRPNRGAVLTREQLEGIEKYYRYHPENADGVAARSLPGVHPKGAFFTRGSGHNKYGGYTEMPDDYQEVMDRLARKHRAAANAVPAPEIRHEEGATVGLVCVGGCDGAVREALGLLREGGIVADTMRIRAFPFADSIGAFLDAHPINFVIEQNRDAQLKTLLLNETNVKKRRLRSILVYGGFPLSSGHVVRGVKKGLAEPS